MNAFILWSNFERFIKPFNGLNQQIAHFSKYISKSRTKRLPLTTKRAGKGYYKGNGSRKEGVISSKGIAIYITNELQLLNYFFKDAFV